jgi:hypothetical protein
MPSRFLSPAYEVMLSAASPGINFLRGVAGYQDPIGTPAMQDRMLELEAQKGPSGSIGYEDYGLPVSSEGGRFTGGLPSLLLSNPIDFGLAGSVGRYGYSPEGRTGLKYDFTPDEETGSTGNAILDFINKGGIKNYISESKGLPFALPDLSLGAPTFNFNRNKTTQPDFINASQDYYRPMAMRKDLGMDTSYGVANEPDVEQDQEYIDQVKKSQGGGIGGLLKFLVGLAVPGAGFLMNLPGKGLEGIRSLNQRIQGSDFGQAKSIADYLDMRKYGGAQGRRDAAARNMAQARGLQKQIDQRPSAIGGGGGGGGQDMGASVSRSAAATRSRDLGSMRGGVGR